MSLEEHCSSLGPENLVSRSTEKFQWQDFLVLGLVLGISGVIGIFFAWKDRNKSTEEYMLGGGKVNPIPVALSLATTFFSAITILGTPVEYYSYGTMFTYFVICYLITIILAAEVFGPMYKEFGLTSMYEYLELRFNKTVRLIATVEFILQNIIYIGMVIYTPAVALETTTGLDKWAAVWITGGVCIFYTSIGGLKAVVWTDSFQILVMLAGFVAILAKGSIDHDGFGNVLDSYRAGNRTVWDDFQPDPRYRHTFWSIVIGGVLGTWGNSFCTSQSFVQRALSCKDKRDIRIAMYCAWFFISAIVMLAAMAGMVLFKYNECCDPHKAGWVDSTDQLVPYLAVTVFKASPGVAGLYVSGAFSGTLSTVSSGINSMTTCLVTDIIRPNFAEKSEKFYTWLSKGTSVLFGLLCIAFSYIAANLGGILQAALSINGMLGGPTLGMFLIAIFNPFIEKIGVIIGYLSGIAIAAWCYVGSTSYPPLRKFTKILPTIISGCEGEFSECVEDSTEAWCETPEIEERPLIAEFYSISYMYLGTLGLLTTVIVGCTISAIIQCTRWRVDPRELPKGVLFPPLDRKYKRYDSRKSSSENYQGDGIGVKSVAFEMNEEKDSENKYMAVL